MTLDDAAGFSAFYREHVRDLTGFFLHRTGDPELAMDLTAETFAEALAGRRRFDPRKGTESMWLYGIARHKLARALERGRVEDRARRRLEMGPLVLDERDYEEIADRALTSEAVIRKRVSRGLQSGAEPACGEAWNPPQSDEPVPDVITARMAIFRRPAGAAENTPDPRMTGRQARHVYADGRRTLPETGKWGVHAIAADILPRAQVGRQGDPCAAPQGTTEPGVCLVLTRKSGAMSACFTLGEIERGQAFIDADGRIMGFAPDGVRQARTAEHRARVEDNLFTLPGGPQTKVDFEPAVTG